VVGEVSGDEGFCDLDVALVAFDGDDIYIGEDFFQDDEGAGEKAAAYDGDALGGASLEQFAEGFFVFLKHEALEERRDQDESFEGAEDLLDPAEDSGPGTRAGVELFILREIVPVSAGVGVM